MLGGVVSILNDALPNDAEVVKGRHKLKGSHSTLGADVPLDDGRVISAGSAPDVFLLLHAPIITSGPGIATLASVLFE